MHQVKITFTFFVNYPDDRKLFSDSVTQLMREHLEYCEKHDPNLPGKGLSHHKAGSVRWEIED